MEKTRYRIVVRGRLSPAFGSGLGGVTLEVLQGTTALEGHFSDPAELRGMLERLRNLGIEVVSVDALG